MSKTRRFRPYVLLGLGILCLLLLGLGLCANGGFLIAKQPPWVSALLFGLSALALFVLLLLIGLDGRREEGGEPPLWKKLLFSDLLLGKSRAHAIAYTGVVAALCVVSNMLELHFATTQYSITTAVAILAGAVLGPVLGFSAVFLGDGVGYLVNSMGYPYYWWVALSVAAAAALAGLCMRLPFRFRGALYLKLALACLLALFVCSVGINSTGMYFIGLKRYYMPPDVQEAVSARFGGELTFGIYLIVRYFILGQIWVSLVNFVLLFALAPALKAAKVLG